jgi:HEPN domain-containing protein
MQPEAARIAGTRNWIDRAAEDRRAGEVDFTADPPLLADIVFHAQQLAEKSLNAFLVWHDQPFRHTHDLIEIGNQCVGIDSSLSTLARRAAVHTEYAWRYRYPGATDVPPVAEAREALDLAREVYDAILERLPGEVRPRCSWPRND